jgi:hypothetical protein
MKKYLLFVFALCYAASSFAQDIPAKDVPSVVANVFKKQFPKATDVEWERKNELYKVEFEINRQEHSMWIDGSGNVARHKQDIRAQDLPAAVRSAIARDYKDYKIDDVEKSEAGNVIHFKVELKKGSEDIDVFFDLQGEKVENAGF